MKCHRIQSGGSYPLFWTLKRLLVYWIRYLWPVTIEKKTKKVKFFAYHDRYDLHWRIHNSHPQSSWLRVPSEDKEVEVEDE